LGGLEPDDDEDDEDSDDEDEDDGLGNDGNWFPLHWAGALGDKCPAADFHEIARDHADALGSGDPEGELLPIHCAAAAANPNFDVLQAMVTVNPRIFSEKDRQDRLPLHYAARIRRAWRVWST
jgi:ankyrin repeat protein